MTKKNKSKKTTKKKKTTEQIAKEVIAGKWGTGDTRKKALTKAGYDYYEVQDKVNEILKATTYTIKFNANGGTGKMDSRKAREGETLYLPENKFTRKGYKFVGWAIKKDKGTVNMKSFQIGKVKYKDKAKVKDLGNITLYAVWKGNGAKAACDWAIRIANDDSFSYGKKPYASRCGCYFCGTNGKKKQAAKKAGYYHGDKWDKTYVCCTFVNAAYAHGANNNDFLTPEKNGKMYLSGDNDAAVNMTRSAIKLIGKPKKEDLKAGDILLIQGRHTSMYIGGGKYVEANSNQSDPFSPSTIAVKELSDKTYSKYTHVFRLK